MRSSKYSRNRTKAASARSTASGAGSGRSTFMICSIRPRELVPVLDGDAEQFADHGDGQGQGQIVEDLAPAAFGEHVDALLDDGRHAGPDARHG